MKNGLKRMMALFAVLAVLLLLTASAYAEGNDGYIPPTHDYVEKLTLEPLAENAVRHGVRENPEGKGSVSIATLETPDHYEIIVVDDGPGFDPNMMPADGEKHIGIANVRERLMKVSSGSVEFDSAPGKGTTARIMIPKE